MVKCLVCGGDDDLVVLCGRHWSEYVRWRREGGATVAVGEESPTGDVREVDRFTSRPPPTVSDDA